VTGKIRVMQKILYCPDFRDLRRLALMFSALWPMINARDDEPTTHAHVPPPEAAGRLTGGMRDAATR
jgi:hypothetical protein